MSFRWKKYKYYAGTNVYWTRSQRDLVIFNAKGPEQLRSKALDVFFKISISKKQHKVGRMSSPTFGPHKIGQIGKAGNQEKQTLPRTFSSKSLKTSRRLCPESKNIDFCCQLNCSCGNFWKQTKF